jgi:hypothetical protein
MSFQKRSLERLATALVGAFDRESFFKHCNQFWGQKLGHWHESRDISQLLVKVLHSFTFTEV